VNCFPWIIESLNAYCTPLEYACLRIFSNYSCYLPFCKVERDMRSPFELHCSTYSIRKSQVKKGCLERDCCSGTRCLTLGTTSSDVCERNSVSHNAEMFGRDWLVLSSAVLIPKKGRKPLEPWSQIR